MAAPAPQAAEQVWLGLGSSHRGGDCGVSTETLGVQRSEKTRAKHDKVQLSCLFTVCKTSFKTVGLKHSVPEQPSQSSAGKSKRVCSQTPAGNAVLQLAGIFLNLSLTLRCTQVMTPARQLPHHHYHLHASLREEAVTNTWTSPPSALAVPL